MHSLCMHNAYARADHAPADSAQPRECHRHASRDSFSKPSLLEPLRTARIAAVCGNRFQSHMTYDACPTSSRMSPDPFPHSGWGLGTRLGCTYSRPHTPPTTRERTFEGFLGCAHPHVLIQQARDLHVRIHFVHRYSP